MYAPNTNLARACVRVRAYARERTTLRAKKKPLAHGVCERRVGLFQPVFFFKRVELIFGYRVIIYA